MSRRYKGAIISATPPTTTGGESGTAPGEWTLQQQAQAQNGGIWPTQPTVKYVEDVFSTYLYAGNGSSQSINNGILLGNGYSGWYFQSNGVATTTFIANKGRTNTFTIEFYVMKLGGSTNQWVVCTSQGFYNSTTNQEGFLFGLYDSGAGTKLSIAGTNFGAYGWQGSTTIADNTLYHVSINFNGSTLSVYANGVLESTSAGTTSFPGAYALLDSFLIGAGLTATGGTLYTTFSGNIGTISVYNSVQRTGNFTPPPSGLVAVTGNGGLVWTKSRTNAAGNRLSDTARGIYQTLFTNTTDAQVNDNTYLTAFNSNGFTLGATNNSSGQNYGSWTFRKQSKFFDIVTYTGDGTSGRQIPHSLASIPGFIVIKRTSATSNWICWHRSSGAAYGFVNTTGAFNSDTAGNFMGNDVTYIAPTSSIFTLGSAYNVSGSTYVAYIFAHDAGGFGPNFTDNVISCGSWTGSTADINLGYEPQWLFVKKNVAGWPWYVIDNMRGLYADPINGTYLQANSTAVEGSINIKVTSTGFTQALTSGSESAIYIAIRRGPMRTPTDATTVFDVDARSGTGTTTTVTTGFPSDMYLCGLRGSNSGKWPLASRLTGTNYVRTPSTTSETDGSGSLYNAALWQSNLLINIGDGGSTPTNASGSTYVDYNFKRAPGFFDVVCYSGNGASSQTITHNLAAYPELMIVKERNGPSNGSWQVYSAYLGADYGIELNDAGLPIFSDYWGYTPPTPSVFTVGSSGAVNASSTTYVAYLFASCPNVCKVGIYDGTSELTTINCEFTGGARWVMIKQTSYPGGDWYVWDTARGMVSGTDPSLKMNTTSAESNANSVYTTTGGFQVLASPAVDINTSGATYIYIAIA